MRLLFRAHAISFSFGGIVESGFLRDLAARFDNADLTVDFKIQRLANEAERIHILDFSLRAKLFLSARTHADVGIATQRTFLHIAIADARVEDDFLQPGEVFVRLRGGSDIGFADNFDERDSTAIQVDGCTFTGIRKPLVQALTRVLFEMQSSDADVLSSGCGRNLDLAKLCQGLVVLRNLITLGQIGIKIILAREDRCLINAAAQRHRRQHREIYRLTIQYWQRSGKTKAYRANVSIWWIAKARRARAENFAHRQKLDVHFQADHRLILGAGRYRGFQRRGHIKEL